MSTAETLYSMYGHERRHAAEKKNFLCLFLWSLWNKRRLGVKRRCCDIEGRLHVPSDKCSLSDFKHPSTSSGHFQETYHIPMSCAETWLPVRVLHAAFVRMISLTYLGFGYLVSISTKTSCTDFSSFLDSFGRVFFADEVSCFVRDAVCSFKEEGVPNQAFIPIHSYKAYLSVFCIRFVSAER